MKRFMIVGVLIGLFFAFVLAISSCSGLAEVDTSSLANSISSQNGPGSGKWSPPEPANKNQCQQLFSVENDLIATTINMGETHPKVVAACYDAEGNRIENSDNPLCQEPVQVLEEAISRNIVDMLAGYKVYNNACTSSDAPLLDMPQSIGGVPINHKTEETEDDKSETDPYDPWNGPCCLTCLHKINNSEFAFIDLNMSFE